MPDIKIINNEALIAMKKHPDNHFHSAVTDPPYGISFMSKKWDYEIPSVELWKEVFRVLRPGGYILVACGTRTQHRMAVNIEDAGFEIRDIVSWIYGSGFPKALDISKAIDKMAGAERKVIGSNGTRPIQTSGRINAQDSANGSFDREENLITEPTTEEAKQWDGWKTALKPAQELWTLARKPLSEDTIAKNILKWGVGGINIDGCRIELNGDYKSMANGRPSLTGLNDKYNPSKANQLDTKGRFPANVIFDEEAGKILDGQTGITKSGSGDIGTGSGTDNQKIFGKGKGGIITSSYADEGGASRFFYCAKASKSERNKGLEDESFKKSIGHNRFDKCKI